MNKHAFLVGVGEYDRPAISPVRFAAHDAESLGGILRERCGFSTTVLLNPIAGEFAASLGDLMSTIEDPEDIFCFYFGGHGVVYDNESYLLFKDAYPEDRLGMYQLSALRGKFERLRCRSRLVFLDCCRNDPRPGRGDAGNMMGGLLSAALNGLAGRDVALVGAGDGGERLTLLLKACGEGERAYEWEARRHGAFTWFLREGLSGAAWRDGALSAHDLCNYVSAKVRAWAEGEGVRQRPDFRQDGLAGDIVLAGAAAVAAKREDAEAARRREIEEHARRAAAEEVERLRREMAEAAREARLQAAAALERAERAEKARQEAEAEARRERERREAAVRAARRQAEEGQSFDPPPERPPEPEPEPEPLPAQTGAPGWTQTEGTGASWRAESATPAETPPQQPAPQPTAGEKKTSGYGWVWVLLIVGLALGIGFGLQQSQPSSPSSPLSWLSRVQEYNAKAESDIRNLKIAEEVLMTDYQMYGATRLGNHPGSGSGKGDMLTGPLNAASFHADDSYGAMISGTRKVGRKAGENYAVGIVIANNVSLEATTIQPDKFDVNAVVKENASEFYALSKHRNGDRVYLTYGFTTAIYYCENDAWKGTAGIPEGVRQALMHNGLPQGYMYDDTTPCGGSPVGHWQVLW